MLVRLDDGVPIDQPPLPGLLRTCTACGEEEGSRFASDWCVFEQPGHVT
jgi:hypothetical protein